MTKYTKGKIRDFELTMEEAGRLAECLNSFDDSDSWPGGFTHGNPFTAKRVFDWKKKSEDIRTIVGYVDDKIVGHCNVCRNWLDPEAAYVGLLGANPAYHGQGFGKAMLIEAAETAARSGMRRIDLHTWGGNLKAMPLYKKVGYNWVPGTRVLMESHIPGILEAPMFKEFFDRYFWYDACKREIKQEIDEISIDGIGVFKYHFEGENGDLLDVTIDREAKGICGFSLTLDGNTISGMVTPTSHFGYIGIGEYPFEMRLENQTDNDLTYSIQANPSTNFSVTMKGNSSGIIAKGATVVLNGAYTILKTAEHLDKEIIPDEKVLTQTEWLITLGDKSIQFYSGLIPQEAITLSCSPSYPSLAPNERKVVGLGLRNNTEDNIKGKITFTTSSGQELEINDNQFSLNAEGEMEIPLELHARPQDEGKSISIIISVFVEEERNLVLVNRKTLEIPIIGAAGAYTYESIDGHIVIENETLLITMKKAPPMNFRLIHDKVNNRSLSGWFLLPELGYPFPSGGSEWTRKKFDITLRNEKTFAEMELQADSVEKPDLRLTLRYRIYPGRKYLELIVGFRNMGANRIENLGFRTSGWLDFTLQELIVPIRGNIHRLASLEWDGRAQVPRKGKEYHESWAALQGSEDNALIGYIWDSEWSEEVYPYRQDNITRIEYKLPDLEPGQSIERRLLTIMAGSGNWREVRSLWARFNGKSIHEKEPIEIKSDLEVELIPAKRIASVPTGSPVFIDSSKKITLLLRVRVIHEDPITADIALKLPEGLFADGSQELQINADEISLDHPFEYQFDVTSESGSWLRTGGEIVLSFVSRIQRIPLAAIVYDSQIEKEEKSIIKDGKSLYTILAGGIKMDVSPDYCASLVRFGYQTKESIFFDTFPKAESFIWWNPFFSGVNPFIAGWDIWDWESEFAKETWTLTPLKRGAWKGYEIKSMLKHNPKIKGMEFSVRYLTLPGVPIVHILVLARNTTKQWKKFWMGLRGTPRPGGVAQGIIHSVSNNERIIYEPTEHEARLDVQSEEGWLVFDDPKSGEMVGIIASCKSKEGLIGANMGRDAERFVMRALRELKPGEETILTGYVVIPPDVDSMQFLKKLPSTVE